MISHFFIHASRAILNRQDLPSLILENINGRPLLHYQLERLTGLRFIQQVNIVTSDLDIDAPIVACAHSFKNERQLSFEVIRIPHSSDYAFRESNRIISDNFLYKMSLFGFFNAQYLNEYAVSYSIDAALLAVADDVPLIEPSLLDTAVQEYGRKGASYGTRFPGERILVIPTHDLHAKITSCKYSKERKTKEEIEKVRETAVSLANLKNEKSIEEISQQQIINLKKRSGNPLSCDDILSHMHETGYVHHVRAAEAYQFYPVHRQTDAEFIKHILSFRKDVTFDNRIAIQKLIDEKTRPLAPVTIEVELTSRTNTKVSVPPFTLMKHYECDLSIEQYRTIINTFSNDLLYLVLDGFGEPTLHPNLLECIKYAKEQLCFRVCLKTNGYFLNTDMMSKLIQSPLDILIIDVDEYDALSRPLETTDSSYPSEKLILSILEIRAKFNKETPYILLQCMNSMSNQINVQYYYNRWARIVDAVVIQPHNDYLPVPSSDELIDLSPTGQHINCFKTTQTLLILANGKPVLCKQKPDGFQPSKESDLHSIWLDNYLQGGTFDFCQQCIHKFYREGMQPDRFISSLHFAIQNTAYSILPDKLFSECTQNDTAKKQKLLEEIMQFYPDHPKIQEIIASLVTTK